MFEQFKENRKLVRDTYRAAGEGLNAGREAFRRSAPLKKAVWIVCVGTILVNAVASHFAVAWYYRVVLIFLLVFLPTAIWKRNTRHSIR